MEIPDLTFTFSSTQFGMMVRADMRDEDHAKLERIFSNIYQVPEEIDQALELIADYMRGSFADNFAAQGRPAWEPLSDSYREWRLAAGLGDVILEITGELKAEVTQKGASGNVEEIIAAGKTTTLVMGGSSDKFRWHQLGASGSRGAVTASPGKTLRWFGPGGEVVFRKSVGPASFTIPARPMVDVQPEDRDEITRILRDWIWDKLES